MFLLFFISLLLLCMIAVLLYCCLRAATPYDKQVSDQEQMKFLNDYKS